MSKALGETVGERVVVLVEDVRSDYPCVWGTDGGQYMLDTRFPFTLPEPGELVILECASDCRWGCGETTPPPEGTWKIVEEEAT